MAQFTELYQGMLKVVFVWVEPKPQRVISIFLFDASSPTGLFDYSNEKPMNEISL